MRKLLLMRTLVLVAATGWIATEAVTVLAQQKPNAGTVYYDQYEPSERQRLRRETCAKDEESMGPYCTKKCDKGYLMVKGSKPARCRAIEPLAPGVMPTAVRKQVGVQPPPPGPPQVRRKGDGQG